MGKTVAFQNRINVLPHILQEPETFKQRKGSPSGYAVKMGLGFVSSLTGSAASLVQIIRKITEAVGPSLAHLTHSTHTWKALAQPFIHLVDAIDLFDIIGDANFFFNGAYLKEKAKKHYHVIAARIAFVPASILGIMLHAKQALKLSYETYAATIGNIRVFKFVPRVAEAVQNWPLVRSIPDLHLKAAAIGNLRIFGLVTKLSLLTTARVAVGLGYGCFTLHAMKQQAKYEKKSLQYQKKLSDYNIVVKPADKSLKVHFEKAGIISKEEREEIGTVFVKYKNNLIKAKQAKLNKFASGTEVVLRIPVLFGLAAGASVGASVALALLGTASFLSIAYATYNKYKTQKYELKNVI